MPNSTVLKFGFRYLTFTLLDKKPIFLINPTRFYSGGTLFWLLFMPTI